MGSKDPRGIKIRPLSRSKSSFELEGSKEGVEPVSSEKRESVGKGCLYLQKVQRNHRW